MRVLVTVEPRMYREAIALSIHRHRPGLDVRVAPPGDAEAEVAAFGPRLLIHNDTAAIGGEALASVPFRVEVLYSDAMGARVSLEGRVAEDRDMDTEGLLRAVDAAAGPAGREAEWEAPPGG